MEPFSLLIVVLVAVLVVLALTGRLDTNTLPLLVIAGLVLIIFYGRLTGR